MQRNDQRRSLQERQRYLYLRLEDGYNRIEQALAESRDVTRWEDVWLALLAEYERISDRLDQVEAA